MDSQELANFMAKELYSITKEEAISKGICLECKQIAAHKCYSEAGRREYQISGICEKCFDEIFA